MSIIPPVINNIDVIDANSIIGGVKGAFLSDKQKDQIIDGESAMREANDSIDDTRYEIKDATNEADKAEAQGKDGESKKAEAQNQASDANAMNAQTANAQSNAANSSQKAGAANTTFEAASGAIGGLVAEGNSVVEEQTQEVEDIDAEIEELSASIDEDLEILEAAESASEDIEAGETPVEGEPTAEYDPNLANGPVGAGNASADQTINSLQTQTEKDEENGTVLGTPAQGTPGANGTAPMPKPAPAPVAPKAPADPVQSEVATDVPAASSSSTPDFDPEEVKAATERVTENQSAIETYTTRSSVTLERINENTENTQALMQEQQDAVQASIDEGNAENEGLANAAKAVGVISQVGSYTEKTGQVTEAVGVGLETAGSIVTVAGEGTVSTGGFLQGLGAGLTSLGAPLCSLFGIGSPIVAGGTVTLAGGSATEGVGVSVTATGTGLVSGGQTTQTVGETTKRVGQGLSLGANTANVAITAASGDWRGAITSGLNVAASAASFAGDFIKSGAEAAGKAADCIDKISDVTGRIASGASMVDNAAKTVEAFQNGDLEGGIKSGLNMTLSGMAMGATSKSGFSRAVSNTQAGLSVADSGMNLARTIQNGGDAKDIAKASWSFAETSLNSMGTVAHNKDQKAAVNKQKQEEKAKANNPDANNNDNKKPDNRVQVAATADKDIKAANGTTIKKGEGYKTFTTTDDKGNTVTEYYRLNDNSSPNAKNATVASSGDAVKASGKNKGNSYNATAKKDDSNKYQQGAKMMSFIDTVASDVNSFKKDDKDKDKDKTNSNNVQQSNIAYVEEEDPKKNISLSHRRTTC